MPLTLSSSQPSRAHPVCRQRQRNSVTPTRIPDASHLSVPFMAQVPIERGRVSPADLSLVQRHLDRCSSGQASDLIGLLEVALAQLIKVEELWGVAKIGLHTVLEPVRPVPRNAALADDRPYDAG
jgi:hypothetical protein